MSIYNINGKKISNRIALLTNYGDLSTENGFLSAFNAAVNDVNIDGIEIPYGNYTISSSLNMRSNFKIKGNCSTINLNGNVNVFYFNNKTNCIIEDLCIDMHQTKNSTSGTALYILDSSFLTFRNIIISNIGVRACLAYTSDATVTGKLESLMFDNITMLGIGETNDTQSEWPCGIIAVNVKNSVIRNCHVSGMSRFTLEYKNYSSDSIMINNVIDGGETGIAIGGDRPVEETVLASNIVFSNNVVKNCKYPLYFGRSKGLIVSNNNLTGESMFIEKCYDSVFASNIIENNIASSVGLLNLRYGDGLYFNGNQYIKNDSVNMFNVIDATNILVNGFWNGTKVDELNPSSGTPSAA